MKRRVTAHQYASLLIPRIRQENGSERGRGRGLNVERERGGVGVIEALVKATGLMGGLVL